MMKAWKTDAISTDDFTLYGMAYMKIKWFPNKIFYQFAAEKHLTHKKLFWLKIVLTMWLNVVCFWDAIFYKYHSINTYILISCYGKAVMKVRRSRPLFDKGQVTDLY